jgi:DNA-binding CsgD family transcriptional regulator
VAAACGAPDRAARLCGAVANLLDDTGAILSPAGETSYERAVTLATGLLGERAFAVAWADGRALPLPDVLAEAVLPLPAEPTGLPAEIPEDLPPRDPRLSRREREVLRLIAAGRSNQEIAESLGITLLTTKTHVAHVFAKLAVPSRAAAAAYAHRRGLA